MDSTQNKPIATSPAKVAVTAMTQSQTRTPLRSLSHKDYQATPSQALKATCHVVVALRNASHSTLLSRFVPLLTNSQVTQHPTPNHPPVGAGRKSRFRATLWILPMTTWVNTASLTLMERFRLESMMTGSTFSTTNIQDQPREQPFWMSTPMSSMTSTTSTDARESMAHARSLDIRKLQTSPPARTEMAPSG